MAVDNDDEDSEVGRVDVTDIIVDAVAKQLEFELESTVVDPLAVGESPLPMTAICRTDPARKSGVQRYQVFVIPVSR